MESRIFRVLFLLAITIFILPLFTPHAISQAKQEEKKKVLYINSYDLDSSWGLGTLKGALNVFNIQLDEEMQLDDSQGVVHFRLFNMKTKKNKSEEYKKKVALEAKAIIESWQPDLVICADDNASKYLIVPYFKDSDIPFVFCGVNWSAKEYGFPTPNITGMIEVFPIQEALNILQPFAKGEKIGFLASDTLSERKNGKYIREIFNLNLEERYVSTLKEFEEAYRGLQESQDLLIIIEVTSISDFDEAVFLDITQKHISIPTVSFANLRLKNFLLICKRVQEEQGEWAATTALRILHGTSPASIPIAMNQKAAIRLNMQLAKKLGIKFPMEVIERASFVSEEIN